MYQTCAGWLGLVVVGCSLGRQTFLLESEWRCVLKVGMKVVMVVSRINLLDE